MIKRLFIRPSLDGTYYGMVMSVLPFISPSVYPSVRVSVSQSQFSALFSYMLWHIELKFCMSLSSYENSIKFECRQFPLMFAGVMPLLKILILEIHSFPHFSPTYFDIVGRNFAYDFVLLYYRSSLSFVNLRQFLRELWPFWNCPFDISVGIGAFVIGLGQISSFLSSNTKNTQFFALFSDMPLHIELKICIRSCLSVLQIKFQCHQFASIFVVVMPLLELRIMEIHSFPLFSLTCFDILSWNFTYDFDLLHYRQNLSVFNML